MIRFPKKSLKGLWEHEAPARYSCFLWYITGELQLPISVRDEIRNPDNEIYLSVASVWEALIKYMAGKLELPENPADYLIGERQAHKILSLSIEESDFSHLLTLPRLHNDPFDRILVAQALQRRLTLVTGDKAIQAYPVSTLQWK
jgi:PIN domain nuclease of toxin-antitoxin system